MIRSAPFVACLAIASSVAAQCFETSIGTRLSLASDTIAPNNALGFAFPWPDGTTSTSIDIDENGRILPSGRGALSQSFPDPYEIINGLPSLMVFWTDLEQLGSGADGIYFRTNGTDTAWVTWEDVVIGSYGYGYYGYVIPFTVQAELRSDGTCRFSFDQDTAAATYYYVPGYGGYYNGLPAIGVSAGGGVNDPGSRDLSNALFGSVNSGLDPIVYEDFNYYYYGFDLADEGIEFRPNGSGGYVVSQATCMGGTAQLAFVSRTCVPRAQQLLGVPDGAGGYSVTPGTTDFSGSFGSSLGQTFGVSTQALGFNFTMPGGQVVTSIDIDPNGRIQEGSRGSVDDSPSVAELLGSTGGVIAPFWTDLVSDRFSDIFFSTDNAGTARITWWQFMQPGSFDRLSFRLELRAPGTWECVYEDVSAFAAADLLVGCSGGGGAADPGESDFSAGTVGTGGGATAYELFSSSEVFDLSGGVPFELLPSSRATLGTVFRSRLDTIPPTATLAAVLIGFSNPALNLGLVFPGLDCDLATNPVLTVNMASRGWSPGTPTASFDLDLTNVTMLTGLQVYLQGLIVDPTLPWAGTTLPIGLTNGMRVTL